MSIDERLRLALRTDDLEPEGPQLAAALRSVEAGAHRRRLVRGGAVAGLAAACTVTAALALVPRGHEGAVPPTPLTSPSPSASTSPAGSETRGPLDGQWASAPLTRAAVAAHLRDEGLGRWADRYVRTLPAGSFRVTLNVYQSQVAATMGEDVVDREAFVVSRRDRTAVLQPFQAGYGSTTLRWRREGQELVFTYDGGDHRGWAGIPAAVHQTAAFTTAAFSRR